MSPVLFKKSILLTVFVSNTADSPPFAVKNIDDVHIISVAEVMTTFHMVVLVVDSRRARLQCID